MDGASNERKRNIDGQMSLFGLAEDAIDIPKIVFPNIKEFDKRHILLMEKEMTGLYLSGHPLDEYKQSLKLQTSTTIETIEKSYEIFLESINAELDESMISEEPIINDNDTVIVGGILTEVNQKVTRNNTMMAFLKLEDLTGTIEVIVFPKALDRLRDIIKEDTLVK